MDIGLIIILGIFASNITIIPFILVIINIITKGKSEEKIENLGDKICEKIDKIPKLIRAFIFIPLFIPILYILVNLLIIRMTQEFFEEIIE